MSPGRDTCLRGGHVSREDTCLQGGTHVSRGGTHVSGEHPQGLPAPILEPVVLAEVWGHGDVVLNRWTLWDWQATKMCVSPSYAYVSL